MSTSKGKSQIPMSGDFDEHALFYHQHPRPGKLEIQATKPLGNQRDLALAYSPGVAAPCLAIQDDPGLAAGLYLAESLGPLGYPEQAMRTAVDALNLAIELRHPFSQACGNCYILRLLQWSQNAEAVEERHYPDLPPARPMPMGEAMRGALWFMCIVIAVNLVGLIFYLISGPLAPLIFWTVNGYLFGREYFELVALRRLQPPEMRAQRRKNGFQIWLSGALMAVPLSVPIVNLVVPVIGVATYTHMYHRLSGNRPTRRT